MIKLNITDEMIEFIKASREKYGVKASELAKSIKKTSAYISKFDNGDFKTITYEDLHEMVSSICHDKDLSTTLIDNFLTEFILKVDDIDEIENDYGLLTYDDVIRTIEIPTDLIDYINNEIEKNKLEISTIVNKANENADLDEYAKNPKYEVNTYYSIGEDEPEENQIIASQGYFIKINLEESIIIKILNHKFHNY